MPASQVTVLGAGLAGLAAAQSLIDNQIPVEVYEKNTYRGGHAFSHQVDGFVFDEGPHISFTKQPEIKQLFAEAVSGNYSEQKAQIINHWYGHWITHPAQTNLYGLPVNIVERCLVDFIDSKLNPKEKIENYEDWCYQSLGKSFTDLFTIPYTLKYWTTEPANMSTDWVGPRVYSPALEEVIHGALSPNLTNHHYLTDFRYPDQGGFGAYLKAFSDDLPIHYKHHIFEIDLKQKTVSFTNGNRIHFEHLVSSLPLPVLIDCIKDAPHEVKEAAQRLVCTSLTLVNIGLKRDTDLPDAHWLYVYDEDIIFSRVNFPHRLSLNNVPEGCVSIQAEIYESRYRPLNVEDAISKCVSDLRRIGLIDAEDSILTIHKKWIPFANVLFDHYRASSLHIIQHYLASHDVACCGRYGEWAYYWSDDSIMSGRRAVQSLID